MNWRRLRRLRRVGAVTAAVVGGLVVIAAAAPPTPPAAPAPATATGDATTTTTSATYDAWVLTCQSRTAGADATKVCGISTTVTVKDAAGQQAVATVVTVRSVPKSPQIEISMQLPIIVWLPTGVALRDAGDRDIARLAFVACHGDACEAVAPLTAAQLAGLRNAGDQVFAFYHAQTGQNVKVSFGLKGFGAALDAMLKQLAE